MCYNNGTYQQKDKNMKEELQRKNVFMVVYGVETMKEVLLIFRADYKSIKNVESTKSESLQLSINPPVFRFTMPFNTPSKYSSWSNTD